MKRSYKEKILFTGGHLTPAIAVLNELKKRGYTNYVWIGQKRNQKGSTELSPEFITVRESEVKFYNLRTGKLDRTNNFINLLRNFFLIFFGLISSLTIILKERPKIIMSFGGFLAVPVVIVGKIFGSKILTHEQTIVVGLANKIISKLADKVLISWESSANFFDSKKVVLTGNPIRRDIFLLKSNSLTKDFDRELPTLLIMGGNQGSHEINSQVFKIIEELLQFCNIIHQTGNSSVTGDYKSANKIRENLPLNLRLRYIVRDYILKDEVGEALNKSDLILSRSGANTISEIMALGKLAILVPIPWSSYDEQIKNAISLVETGLGYIVKQDDKFNSIVLLKSIKLGFENNFKRVGFNNQKIEKCREFAKSKVILDAPQNVANEIESLMYS